MKVDLCLTPYWKSRGRGKAEGGYRRGQWARSPVETSPGPPLAQLRKCLKVYTPQHSCVTKAILVLLSSSITLLKGVGSPNIKQNSRCDTGCEDVSRESWRSTACACEHPIQVSLAPGWSWAIPMARAKCSNAQMGPSLPRAWVLSALSPVMLPQGLSLRATTHSQAVPGAITPVLRLVQGRLVVWKPKLSLWSDHTHCHLVQSRQPWPVPPCDPETLRQLPRAPTQRYRVPIADFPFRQCQSEKPNTVLNYNFDHDPDPNPRPHLNPNPAHLSTCVAAFSCQLLLKPFHQIHSVHPECFSLTAYMSPHPVSSCFLFQMRKSRPREGMCLVQGHRESGQQALGWDVPLPEGQTFDSPLTWAKSPCGPGWRAQQV